MRYYVKNHSDIQLNTMVNNKRPLDLEDREVTKEEIGSNLSVNSTDTLNLPFIISDSDTDIANEYFTDLMTHCKITLVEEEELKTDTDRCSKHSSEIDQDVVDSKEAITETLLKQYKTMKLFGISFNWLAIHKIYRMLLVACNTYISHSIMCGPVLYISDYGR